AEGRVGGRECQGISESSRSVWLVRPARLAICRRQPASKFLEIVKAPPRANARIRRHEQRPSETRLHFRRIDHLLRLHASRRHGERPRCGLLSVFAGRWLTERTYAPGILSCCRNRYGLLANRVLTCLYFNPSTRYKSASMR